jgi:hypothetical protein
MKNNKLLFLILLLLVTAGCSKDDDTNGIVGKWKDVACGLDEESISNYDFGSMIKFNSDGTCIEGEGDTVTSNYTIDDEFIIITDVTNPDIYDKYRYTFSNKNILLRLDYIEGYWDKLWVLRPKIYIYKRIK